MKQILNFSKYIGLYGIIYLAAIIYTFISGVIYKTINLLQKKSKALVIAITEAFDNNESR